MRFWGMGFVEIFTLAKRISGFEFNHFFMKSDLKNYNEFRQRRGLVAEQRDFLLQYCFDLIGQGLKYLQYFYDTPLLPK